MGFRKEEGPAGVWRVGGLGTGPSPDFKGVLPPQLPQALGTVQPPHCTQAFPLLAQAPALTWLSSPASGSLFGTKAPPPGTLTQPFRFSRFQPLVCSRHVEAGARGGFPPGAPLRGRGGFPLVCGAAVSILLGLPLSGHTSLCLHPCVPGTGLGAGTCRSKAGLVSACPGL